jgi:hypothetical protein
MMIKKKENLFNILKTYKKKVIKKALKKIILLDIIQIQLAIQYLYQDSMSQVYLIT